MFVATAVAGMDDTAHAVPTAKARKRTERFSSSLHRRGEGGKRGEVVTTPQEDFSVVGGSVNPHRETLLARGKARYTARGVHTGSVHP